MCRRAEGEKETGLLAGWDAGLRSGGGFPTGVFYQILLMKWAKASKAVGSEAKGLHALRFLKLPSMEIFPWVTNHFISKILIKSNSRKFPRSAARHPIASSPVSFSPSALRHMLRLAKSSEINFLHWKYLCI